MHLKVKCQPRPSDVFFVCIHSMTFGCFGFYYPEFSTVNDGSSIWVTLKVLQWTVLNLILVASERGIAFHKQEKLPV